MIELNGLKINQDRLNLKGDDFDNLKMLCSRKKGALLISDQGRLKHMGFFDRVHVIFSESYRTKVQSNLSRTISNLTQSLEINEKNEAFLQELFFNKLSSLSRNVYQRDLSEHTFVWLRDKMVVEGDIPEKLSATIKAANLYLKMGNFKLANGASTSFQVIQGKIGNKPSEYLGIFKPSSGDPLSSLNMNPLRKLIKFIVEIVPEYFVGKASHIIGGQGYVNEGAATIIEKHLMHRANLEVGSLVPLTHVGKLYDPSSGKGEVGSFQLWIKEEAYIARDALKVGQFYQKKYKSGQPSVEPRQFEFEKMVIFDIISGNCDRHAENWFILPDGSIKLIDGGWSMSPAHGESPFHRESETLYLWKDLGYADRYFSDKARAIIEQMADPENLKLLKEELLEFYNRHLPQEAGFNQDRVRCMEERLLVLHKMMGQKISEIAEIRTKSQIKEVLSR